ncbi:Kinesin-like protein kif1b [Rhizophlyctis rosea]|nr:Kinesin-like protein kif1b [Rhizophlyctis rosea]
MDLQHHTNGANQSRASVQVAIRVRPLNDRERHQNARPILSIPSPTTITAHIPTKQTILRRASQETLPLTPFTTPEPATETTKPRPFSFDHTFWSSPGQDLTHDISTLPSSQADIFNQLGKGLLQNALDGFNACLFAYGQTGSGKTYSMMGTQEDKGIIPRLCETLFEDIKEQTSEVHKFKVEVSYMEIYNERVRDLLPQPTTPTTPSRPSTPTTSRRVDSVFRKSPPPKFPKTYRIREHPITGPYVENLSVHPARSAPEILSLMARGNSERTTAATDMNDTSSRSHAVFTILLTQTRFESDLNLTNEIVSKICLVDLAGSERVKVSNTSGERLKEGANINKSLTTLGLVIKALVERSQHSLHDSDTASMKSAAVKREVFVPYRDSILTWLLRDSLGGNSKTIMLATVSPASIHAEETLSTLRFAQRARNIVNLVSVNENPSAKLIRDLKQEVVRLQGLLAMQEEESREGEDELSILQGRLDMYERQMEELWRKYEEEMSKKLSAPVGVHVVRLGDGGWGVDEASKTSEQAEGGEKPRGLSRQQRLSVEEGGKGLGRRVSLQDIKGSLAVRVEDQELPHFVNVGEGEYVSGIVIYFLREGTTRIGSIDADMTIDDPLFPPLSAIVECTPPPTQEVYITPSTSPSSSLSDDEEDYDTTILINNTPLQSRTRLRHGDRVSFSDYHVFKFNHPREAMEMKKGGVRRVRSGSVGGGRGGGRGLRRSATSGSLGRESGGRGAVGMGGWMLGAGVLGDVKYGFYPTPPRALSPVVSEEGEEEAEGGEGNQEVVEEVHGVVGGVVEREKDVVVEEESPAENGVVDKVSEETRPPRRPSASSYPILDRPLTPPDLHMTEMITEGNATLIVTPATPPIVPVSITAESSTSSSSSSSPQLPVQQPTPSQTEQDLLRRVQELERALAIAMKEKDEALELVRRSGSGTAVPVISASSTLDTAPPPIPPVFAPTQNPSPTLPPSPTPSSASHYIHEDLVSSSPPRIHLPPSSLPSTPPRISRRSSWAAGVQGVTSFFSGATGGDRSAGGKMTVGERNEDGVRECVGDVVDAIDVRISRAVLVHPPEEGGGGVGRGAAFHVYLITIRIPGDEWTIARRYTEFYNLYTQIGPSLPLQTAHHFPHHRYLLPIISRSPAIVAARRTALEMWLKEVIWWCARDVAKVLGLDDGSRVMAITAEERRKAWEGVLPFLRVGERDRWVVGIYGRGLGGVWRERPVAVAEGREEGEEDEGTAVGREVGGIGGEGVPRGLIAAKEE